MADVNEDIFAERAFPDPSPAPNGTEDIFGSRNFGPSATTTPTAVPQPGINYEGGGDKPIDIVGGVKDFGKDVVAGVAGDVAGGAVSSALLASRAINPLVGTGLTLAANYGANLATRRALHGEWQPVGALVDVGIGGLTTVKRIYKIFEASASASASRVGASEALRLKGAIAKEIDGAVSRLRSREGAIPQKLKPDYDRGEVFSLDAANGSLGKAKVERPRLSSDTLGTVNAMAEANVDTLRSYSLALGEKLDNVLASLPTPRASKKYSLMAPEGPDFVSDEFAQALIDLKLIRRQLSEMATDDPGVSLVKDSIESVISKVDSKDAFSFVESLKAITQANRAMEPLFKASGDLKPGQGALLEAYVKMKQSIYDGMSKRAQHVARVAKDAKIDFPREVDGWPTIFSDVNNRMSIDIAIRDASEEALNVSKLRTQALEAGKVSKGTEAAVTEPEIRAPWGGSTSQRLKEESRDLARQGLGELSSRREAAGKFLEALNKGSAPEVVPPSPLAAAGAATTTGPGGDALLRPLRAIASGVLQPKEAKAEDIGLPPGFEEATDMRAEELNFGPSSIMQSLQGAPGPDMMPVNGMLPPEALPPPGGQMPSSVLDSAGMAPPMEAQPSEPLPRTTEEFFSLDAKNMPIELFSDPELQVRLLDAQNGSAEDRRQALWAAMQKFPDRFAPPPSGPLKGYKSLVDDKLMDKAEEDKYRLDMLEAFSKLEDDNDRIIKKARYLSALNEDGTILEAREPVARTVPRSLSKYSPENTQPESKPKSRKEDVVSTFKRNVQAEKKMAYAY